MKRLLLAAAAVGALALSACETPTPYQPLNAPGSQASGGYSEMQIEPNRWSVTFAGNSLTSRQTVETYLLFRSAQLTVQQGFDWFAATDRQTERSSSTYATPDPLYAGWGGGYWGPRWGFYRPGFGWGWGHWGDPYWGAPLDIQQVNRYQATAEIIMGHGPKPDARAFDARSVIDHLQGRIRYPGQQR
jgi:hypothetical protein